MIAYTAVLLVAIGASGQKLFAEHGERFVIGPNAVDIVAVDLNDDGLSEIITADVGRMSDPRDEAPAQSQLSVLWARGNLKYEAQPQLRTGFAPYCIVAANMDVLKAPDLVAASFLATRGRDVSIFRNVGNQVFETYNFGAPTEGLGYYRNRDGDGQPIFTTPGITSLAVRDFNSDGFRDVIATGWSSDVLVYFPGADKTYLGAPVMMTAPGGPRDVETGDLNDDGHSDLAVTMYSRNEVALWQGDGTGAFVEHSRFASRGKLPQRIELADVDHDGELDIVVSHRHADDSIVIFYGEGDFQFPISQEIMLGEERGAIEFAISDIVVDDFDGDGKQDIAAACPKAGVVVVCRNQSERDGGPQRFSIESYDFGEAAPNAVCVSDFNQDGKKDLGVALGEAHAVALLLAK